MRSFTIAAFILAALCLVPGQPAQAYWGGVRIVTKFDNRGQARPMSGKCMSFQGDGYITVVTQPRLEDGSSGGGNDKVFRYDMIADEAADVTPILSSGAGGQQNFFCGRQVNALLSGNGEYSFYTIGEDRSVRPIAENLRSAENLRGMTRLGDTDGGFIFEFQHSLYRLFANGIQKMESEGAQARAYSRESGGNGEYSLWRAESPSGDRYSLRLRQGAGGYVTLAEYLFRPGLRKPRVTDHLYGDQAFVVEEKILHTKTKSETQFKIHYFSGGNRSYVSPLKTLPELFCKKIIPLPDGYYAMLGSLRLIKFRPGSGEMLVWEWEKSDPYRDNPVHVAGNDVVYVDGVFYILGTMGNSTVLISVPESEISERL